MIFGSATSRLQELQLSLVPYPAQKPSLEKKSGLEKLGVKIVLVSNHQGVEESLTHLCSSDELFGVDIETYPLHKYSQDPEAGLTPRKSTIRLIQIYDGNSVVFVFDLLKIEGSKAFLGPLWRKPMVAHNALFEFKHLLQAGIVPTKLGCTLLADRVINGSRSQLKKELGLSSSASLKDLTMELLSLEISKEEQTSDWSSHELSQEQIEYAALDAVLPVKIFYKQKELLKKKGLCRAYEILRDAQHPVAAMELRGIGFNTVLHRARISDWQRENDHLQKEICVALGSDLNLNSGKQLGEWLKEALKTEDLDAWVKTGGGKLSTSTPTFRSKAAVHEIFPKLVEYRSLAKKISSFGEGLYKFIDIPTGRLYGSFSLGATSTGRMASQKPNLQNMPRAGFRDLFCAKEGYVLIGLDYSQQEIRVAALVADDKELLRIYEQGGDVHANTAASLLLIPNESVTKSQRQLAKAVAFGLLYGQGAKGLAIYAKQNYGVEMSEENAEIHRRAFFKTYHGLRTWQRKTGDLVGITGIIRTQSGRIRDFNREQQGYKFNAALNLPIQGAAAEITLRAITRLTPLLCEDCYLVNVIHDEILIEVIESRAKEFANKAKETMEAAFLDIFPEAKPYLKGLVEAKIGRTWAETK